MLKWIGDKTQRAFLVGVVSRGDGCGQRNKAGNHHRCLVPTNGLIGTIHRFLTLKYLVVSMLNTVFII